MPPENPHTSIQILHSWEIQVNGISLQILSPFRNSVVFSDFSFSEYFSTLAQRGNSKDVPYILTTSETRLKEKAFID